MDSFYENIEEYNSNDKGKILTAFDNIIANMLSHNKLNKIKHFFNFITQAYFALLKNIKINSIYYFINKILSKHEFYQILFNHSSDIDFKDFMNPYKKITAKPYCFYLLMILFLIIDDTLHRNKYRLLIKDK